MAVIATGRDNYRKDKRRKDNYRKVQLPERITTGKDNYRKGQPPEVIAIGKNSVGKDYQCQ